MNRVDRNALIARAKVGRSPSEPLQFSIDVLAWRLHRAMRIALGFLVLCLGCSSSDPAAVPDGGAADGSADVVYGEPPCHPELHDGDPCTEGFTTYCGCSASPDRTVAGYTTICCYEGHIERSYPCVDSPPVCRKPPDGGGADASPRSASDFASFAWHWTGLGSGGTFTLDKSCHLESKGHLSYATTARSGSGTVPAAECDAFKTFVVSDSVIGAYDVHGGDKGTCTGATDDYIDSTITYVSGDTRTVSAANGSGCGTIEPFVTLIAKMKALSDSYATTPTDAGSDAPAD